MPFRSALRLSCLLCVIALSAARAMAQADTATISGVITDV